jgi:hypothetical protein
MSLPDIVKGTYVSVLVEDQTNLGTFIPLCGMTTRSFVEQVNTRDQFIRDCSDPENIPVRKVIPTGKQWDLSASGVYNRAEAALVSASVGKSYNYRFVIGEPEDDQVYSSYFEGPAVLSQRKITGDDGDDTTAEMTFVSDGQWDEHVL